MLRALLALVLSALSASRRKLASWGLGQNPLNARQVRAAEAEKRAGEFLLSVVDSWWEKLFQHLGPTPCDSNLSRACIATLNAGVAGPSAGFTAGALTWAATYDPNGNIATTFDPKLQSCVHSFGLLNRLTSQLYTHLAGRELPSLDSITYAYTPNGSLQDVTESKTTASGVTIEQTHRTFDALERMNSQTRDYGSTQKTTLFGYDVKGNRTSVTDFTGASTVYIFDSVDRLKTATTPNGRAEHFYFADGLLQRTEYRPSAGAAPTTVEKRCYDNASRLTTVASGPGGFMADDCPATMGPVVFSRFDYALDANGNRTSQLERRASTTELTEYGYDDLDRLVATVEPTEAKLYELDAVGNRTGEKKTTPSVARALGLVAAAFALLAPADTLAHVRGHFNRADWLTQRENVLPASAPINFLHDANGNTTAEASATSLREYKWDSRNTLTAAFIDGVEAGRYSYDWQLQRVARTAGGSTVEYVLDDKLVLQELDGAHASTRRYHFGVLSPLAVVDSAGPRFLLNDGLGSVSDEVTPSGGLFKQRQYNAWGEYRNSTAPALNEPKLGYEGHQFDPETSLTYARARYLDNRYGVLLSRDAVEGATNDAPSLHRYNWTRVNPLRFLDFDGLDPWEVQRQIQRNMAAVQGGDPSRIQLHARPPENAYPYRGPDALIMGYASVPAAGIEAVANDPGMVGRAAWGLLKPQSPKEAMSRASPLGAVVSGVQHLGDEWVETAALIGEGEDYEAGLRAPILSSALTLEGGISGTAVVKRGIEGALSPSSVLLKPVTQVAKEGASAIGATLEKYSQYLPRAEVGAANMGGIGNIKIKIGHQKPNPLLPGEGRAGTYDELRRAGSPGDDLTPHHMPSDAYMKAQNIPGYTRGEGVSFTMEQPTPGAGGRHRLTSSYARSPDLSLSPRETLAREIWDARKIYQSEKLYTPAIREGLQDVIELNKQKWPGVFDKPAP